MEVLPLKYGGVGAALILKPTSMGPENSVPVVAAGGPYTLRFERLLRYTFKPAGLPVLFTSITRLKAGCH